MTGKSAGPSTTRRWLAVPVAGSIVNSYSPEGRPGPCRAGGSFTEVAGSVSGQAPVQMWRDRRAGQVSAETEVINASSRWVCTVKMESPEPEPGLCVPWPCLW